MSNGSQKVGTAGVALQKTHRGWSFISEAALENYVWENLPQLLGLNPLKKQYVCRGEVCDIVAVDNEKQIVIIELKNSEDRYLIQQLTRYYANLFQEKPFSSEIDYSCLPRLIAIAPSYHRHNLIDRDYSRLTFELLRFSIVRDNLGFHFVLKSWDSELIVKKYPIPYQPLEMQMVEGIVEPPEQLLSWLGCCTREEQEGFLKVRTKLLACHRRMKEIVDRRVVQYGAGKTKLCAEICWHQKEQKPILFMWLPTPSTYGEYRQQNRKPIIGRLRLWTDGSTLSYIGHVARGFGHMKTRDEWAQIPPEKRPPLSFGLSRTSHVPIGVKGYSGYHDSQEPIDFWEVLSDLAIATWLERLTK